VLLHLEPMDVGNELEAIQMTQMYSTSYNIISHNETLDTGTHVFGTITFAKDAAQVIASDTGPLFRGLTTRLLDHSSTALCFLC
jgi:hypothetical protein